jgi:glycosyltransferase involved in cell wall biosynthesis
MTVIEAICCGLPFIAADVEGMRELASENALFFPPADHAALAKNILALARDEDLCDRLRRSSQIISQRFDGKNVARQFEDEYRKLLEHASR